MDESKLLRGRLFMGLYIHPSIHLAVTYCIDSAGPSSVAWSERWSAISTNESAWRVMLVMGSRSRVCNWCGDFYQWWTFAIDFSKNKNKNKLKQENGRTVRLCLFLMKDYNCSCPLCSCQSMAIYYTYNQTSFLGFCAPSSHMRVKD